jgi:hypothetical protein
MRIPLRAQGWSAEASRGWLKSVRVVRMLHWAGNRRNIYKRTFSSHDGCGTDGSIFVETDTRGLGAGEEAAVKVMPFDA